MEFLIILLLLLMNGVFAMYEIALVSSSKARLETLANKGNKRAKGVLKQQEDTEKFLSTIQIGITLIGIVSGAYGGATIADNIEPLYAMIPFLEPYAPTLAIVTVVVLITYLSIVIGELVPKSIALHNPEKWATRFCPFMMVLSKISYPFVWLLSASTKLVSKLMGMKEGEAIESRLMTRQIESAQRMVEGRNFDIRKQLLDYDKVMNQQRTAIYGLRNAILDGENMAEKSMQMMEEIVDELVEQYYHPSHLQHCDFDALNVNLRNFFPGDFHFTAENVGRKSHDQLVDEIMAQVKDLYQARVLYFTEQGINFSEIERMLLLQIIDNAWKQNLYELDQLQNSVSLRGYAQKDPLIEYQKESYKLYSSMLNRVRDLMVSYIFRLQLPPRRTAAERAQAAAAKNPDRSSAPVSKHIGRNDPCPCGSGKKYKKCCGANL